MKRSSPNIYIHKDAKADKTSKAALFQVAAKKHLLSIGMQKKASFAVEKTKEGKPYFVGLPEVYFSITHSEQIWACAFFSSPVGLDMQRYKPHEERIAERFFHEEETQFIKNARDSEAAFFAVWSAKESYVKYTGAGITDAYSAFSVIENGRIKQRLSGTWLTQIDVGENYAGFICAEEPGYTLQLL